MTKAIDYRAIYHDVRRALAIETTTRKQRLAGEHHWAYPYHRQVALKRAKAVSAPRGMAGFRDHCVCVLMTERRGYAPPAPTLSERLGRYIADKFAVEIMRRGGETAIEERDGSQPLLIVERDRGRDLVLLRASGWRHYNRSMTRHAAIAYMCGYDDNGIFAVRVASTCNSIDDAIDFLEPAAVKKARAAGRQVLRQGDVYAVETQRDRATSSDLPARHFWDDGQRLLTHGDGHEALHVPFPAKFHTQSAYTMGRLATRGRGD